MASEFNRILALLRKERGITQKQAAADLGISQAQLSHYEKGIRECSLAFVVQVADYYGVSCDYLLGRSATAAARPSVWPTCRKPAPAPAERLPRQCAAHNVQKAHRKFAGYFVRQAAGKQG